MVTSTPVEESKPLVGEGEKERHEETTCTSALADGAGLPFARRQMVRCHLVGILCHCIGFNHGRIEAFLQFLEHSFKGNIE